MNLLIWLPDNHYEVKDYLINKSGPKWSVGEKKLHDQTDEKKVLMLCCPTGRSAYVMCLTFARAK